MTEAAPAGPSGLAKMLHNFRAAMEARLESMSQNALTQEEAVSLLGKALGHPGWETALREATHPEHPTPATPVGPQSLDAGLMELSEPTLQRTVANLRDAVRKRLVPGWPTTDAQEVMAIALGHGGWHAALSRARRQPPGSPDAMQRSGELIGIVSSLRASIRAANELGANPERIKQCADMLDDGMTRAMGGTKRRAVAPARANATTELSLLLEAALEQSGLRAKVDGVELESQEMALPDWVFPVWVMGAWEENAEFFSKAFRIGHVSSAALMGMEIQVEPGFAPALVKRLMRAVAQEALGQGVGRRAAVDLNPWHDLFLARFVAQDLPWEIRVVATVSE